MYIDSSIALEYKKDYKSFVCTSFFLFFAAVKQLTNKIKTFDLQIILHVKHAKECEIGGGRNC